MKVIIQRVIKASVEVDNKIVSSITNGLLLLVGVTHNDSKDDIDYLVKKIINLRIFSDEEGKINKSLLDYDYEILSVSQFTLYADTKKGNRPGFSESAKPEYAIKIYNDFNDELRKHNIDVQEGIFGANMQVSLLNDGPVTIILDTNNK